MTALLLHSYKNGGGCWLTSDEIDNIIIHVWPKNSTFVSRVTKTGSGCICNYTVSSKPNVKKKKTLIKL